MAAAALLCGSMGRFKASYCWEGASVASAVDADLNRITTDLGRSTKEHCCKWRLAVVQTYGMETPVHRLTPLSFDMQLVQLYNSQRMRG